MANDTLGAYCQNCFTWNPGDREACRKCGTRLLILTAGQAWEDGDEPEDQEDLDEHLLERITNLEESLRRVETYLETVSDQLGRLERSEVMLRNGLMSLVQELEEKDQLDGRGFAERWEDLVEENLQLIGARELFTRYRARILPIARAKSMSQLRRALLETAAFLESAQLPEAAQRLAQALVLDPKNYELIFTVAALKEVVQDFEEAEALVRKVVVLSPRHYEAWMLLAKLIKEDPDQLHGALVALRTAVELRPDEAEPRIQLTELLLEEGNTDAALESAMDALTIQRDGETLQLLGSVLLARGEALKAIAVLKEASGYMPGDLVVRELLAEGYILAGERAKAFVILEELLHQHPGDSGLLLLLDAESAEQLNSAKGGPEAARVLLDDAEEWLKDGKLREAEVLIKQAKRKGKSQRVELLELELAFRRNPEKHLNAVLKFSLSERHPRLCYMALRLALDHYSDTQQEEKLPTILEAFLEAHPKSSGAWEAAVIRQAYRLMAGQMDKEGLEEVKRLYAKPLPGQETRVRTLLCQALLDLNRPKEVIDILEPLMKSDPTLIHHYQLGSALAMLKHREAALSVLQAGLTADRGELAENQVPNLKKKILSLMQELEK